MVKWMTKYQIKKAWLLLIPLFCFSGHAAAEVAVLIHGYASHAFTWQQSGVNHQLAKSGWFHAGLPGVAPSKNQHVFYTVQLPAHESLLLQTSLLLNFLEQLRARHPDERLTLVGHSAGGVVARMAVLRGNVAKVARLVTIASPHSGTSRALQGLEVVNDKPLFCPGPGWYSMKSFFGGNTYDYLVSSQRALIDMLPQGYGGILDWANQQEHPNIEYHAIVRQNGDQYVSAASQDMNQLSVLKGRVRVWLTNSAHGLSPVDGVVLAKILSASPQH